MKPIVTEIHTETEVNVKKIVDRIIRYQKSETIRGLNEISILDKSEPDIGFGCYKKAEQKIEIYLDNILKWQPWVLKKTYIFPFIAIAMALSHELDHHVNRDNNSIDREYSAKTNMIKYIYPSLGTFKPLAKILILFAPKRHRNG